MDLRAMAERLGLEEDEFLEIVEVFIITADDDIKKLETANITKDHLAVSEAAHSLKGASGNLGFMELSDISALLETNARKKDIEDLSAQLPRLVEKLNEIKVSIDF